MQPTAVQSPRVMQMERRYITASPAKTKNNASRGAWQAKENVMKKQFIIKTNIGDIVVSATRGNVRKVAEAMLKNWTSRPVAYKIFPLGNKINKIKEENARTLASLQKGDQVALVPVFYYDNFNNVKINKIVVIAHNVKMEEDFLRRKIYAGDGKFYYSGSHSRRGTCSAHYNQLDVWGNI